MTVQLPVNNKIESEKVFKIAPFKKEIRKTIPHKHDNYFEIIYLSNGAGFHYVDSNHYEVSPPVAFCIRKEQVHHWDLTAEGEGYVLIIKKAFIENSLDKELKLLLAAISHHCCLQLKDAGTIEMLFQMLVKESSVLSEQRFAITEGLLKALLGKILQVAEPITIKAEGKAALYHAFIDLLSSDCGIKNKVAFYAKKLNTSPQNLNTACRRVVNQSATEVLSGFVISEAKRLLLYTENTISEIAFALSFTDPSHFVKFFKKATGSTPHAFRSVHN